MWHDSPLGTRECELAVGARWTVTVDGASAPSRATRTRASGSGGQHGHGCTLHGTRAQQPTAAHHTTPDQAITHHHHASPYHTDSDTVHASSSIHQIVSYSIYIELSYISTRRPRQTGRTAQPQGGRLAGRRGSRSYIYRLIAGLAAWRHTRTHGEWRRAVRDGASPISISDSPSVTKHHIHRPHAHPHQPSVNKKRPYRYHIALRGIR